MGNKKPANARTKKAHQSKKKRGSEQKGFHTSKHTRSPQGKRPNGAHRDQRPHKQADPVRNASKGACPVSNQCGACQLIDVDYRQQLDRKQQEIIELFEDLANEECALHPIIGMKQPYHYRNKVASPFAPGKKIGPSGKAQQGRNGGQKGKGKGGASRREILCGMYAKGTHRIVDTSCCLLENEAAKDVIQAIRQLMPKFGIEPYNEDTGAGFLRHAIVRVGHESNEMLVTLVTNGDSFPASKAFCRELKKRVPAITTIVQNVNTRFTNVILGDEGERTLFGPGFILDDLCGLRFRISAHSFYQVNAVQTEVLYRRAIELAQLTGTEVVMDAYCGTGTIGLVATRGSESEQKPSPAEMNPSTEARPNEREDKEAQAARKSGALKVIGVDKVSNAIKDARNNARHNGIENAEFFAEDAGDFMRKMTETGQTLDVLFMDPPRAGSTTEFLSSACHLAPRCIVYISCNPETQARDVDYLTRHGYALTDIQPVDMFPHTEHIENICRLELKKAAQ